MNDIDGLSTKYANIANGYQQMGNFYKALEYQQRALRLAETEKTNSQGGKLFSIWLILMN